MPRLSTRTAPLAVEADATAGAEPLDAVDVGVVAAGAVVVADEVFALLLLPQAAAVNASAAKVTVSIRPRPPTGCLRWGDRIARLLWVPRQIAGLVVPHLATGVTVRGILSRLGGG
jgi:hypothetical protein